ncbi:MAG: hypothetical protein ACRDND_33090, partial [Streptosporangiaceae bacterium]
MTGEPAATGDQYWCSPGRDETQIKHADATLPAALLAACRYLGLFHTARVWLDPPDRLDPGDAVTLFDVDPGLAHV